jgi:hypothetical protein
MNPEITSHPAWLKATIGENELQLSFPERDICYLSTVSGTSKRPRSDFHIFTWDT